MGSDRGTQQGRVPWQLLTGLLAARRKGLVLGVIVGLLWAASKVSVPRLVRAAIDHGINGDEPLVVWAGIIAAVGVLAAIFMAWRRWLAFAESRGVETTLRARLFEHILGLDVGYHDRAQTGQLMSRASSDLQQIQNFVVMIPLVISNGFQLIAIAILLVTSQPLLALVALAPLPLVNVMAKRFSSRIHPAVMAVQAEQAALATVVEESVSGVRVVKGFGAEAVQAAKLRERADNIRDVSLGAARIRSSFAPAIDLLPSLGMIAVLAIGGHRVIDGDMTIGQLVEFNASVLLLIIPMRNIGMTLAMGQRAAVALQRVDQVLSTAPTIVDPPSPVGFRATSRVDAGVKPSRGDVQFGHVVFGYDPAAPVLRGLDLSIPAGSSLAVVGATGSGKSTIVRLLLRFYDVQSGSVRIDGVDVRHRRLSELRHAVGVVFEDTVLFHDTVAANIAFARPDASADQIAAAADLAGASEFIASLPDGYETMIGERGLSLSGGQRQRIAIARAIVADPDVLVLDDATSAVDPSKEHEIREAMATVMRGRTTIVIAHRPGTIALADSVVLLDGGVIAARGTHDELIASNSRYREVLAAWAATDDSPEATARSLHPSDSDRVDLDRDAAHLAAADATEDLVAESTLRESTGGA